MFKRKEVEEILSRAECIDSKHEMFGASTHKYKLNPPVGKAFVRQAEEKYNFTLPEDYVRFITEVGDGGAGPDYGIYPFGDFLMQGKGSGAEKYWEAYRCSLAKPFMPRPMASDEVKEYAFAEEAYKRSPEKYFVYEKFDYNDLCDTDGFLVIGTHGCQWDFGLIISGEKRGMVFDTDNEGAYSFVAHSFNEFYQNWLDRISDTERFRKELEEWTKIFRKR